MLTRPERSAGRWWRDQRQAALDELNLKDPPMASPLGQLAHIRHLCEALGGKSISYHYAEVYVVSPRIGVCYCSVIQQVPDELLGSFPHVDCAGGALVPAGRFAFVYRAGRCAHCKLTARSTAGRVVDAYERLPAGRNVRQG